MAGLLSEDNVSPERKSDSLPYGRVMVALCDFPRTMYRPKEKVIVCFMAGSRSPCAIFRGQSYK